MSDFYQVSRADLEAINRAMNHMGDILNGMDAVEEEDEAATEAGFKAIQAILASHPSNAVQDELTDFMNWKSRRGEAANYQGDGIFSHIEQGQWEAYCAGIERGRAASHPSNAAGQDAPQPVAYLHEWHEPGAREVLSRYPDSPTHIENAKVTPLYAATVPQVVQAPIPEILFDGHAVYSELTEKERADVVPKSVANVLDAIVRIMRRNAATAAIDVRDAAPHMQPVGKLMSQLWHHQGGSSKVGQPIRRLFGMGQHEPMSFEQIELAKAYEASLKSPPQTGKEQS